MDNARSTATERLRIIWAIAAKDITDAIKNKMIISMVLGMAMMMLSAQAFPFLRKLSATPGAVVYDAGSPPAGTSRLISAMAEDGRTTLEDVFVKFTGRYLGRGGSD